MSRLDRIVVAVYVLGNAALLAWYVGWALR
jgi:hypothetical protein